MGKTIEPIDANFDDVVDLMLVSDKPEIEKDPVKTKLVGWFVEVDGEEVFKTEKGDLYRKV